MMVLNPIRFFPKERLLFYQYNIYNHLTLANLFGPFAPDEAIVTQTSRWLAAKMLMQNWPLSRIFGQLDEVFAGQMPIKGGLRDNEKKDCATKATGASAWIAVATTMPLQKLPSVCLKSFLTSSSDLRAEGWSCIRGWLPDKCRELYLIKKTSPREKSLQLIHKEPSAHT